jgi:class 3 adenylate cyclase
VRADRLAGPRGRYATLWRSMDAESPMNRRFAAILAADIAGYSRLMHEDEAGTVRDLKAHQSVILPFIGQHGGRVIAAGRRRLRARVLHPLLPRRPSI